MNPLQFIKNMEPATVQNLSQMVPYEKGMVASQTLAQQDYFSVTILALDCGTGVGPHVCEGDALVYALDGTGDVIIDGNHHTVQKGECIVMPADFPHAVNAGDVPFQFLLTVVKPQA